MSALCSIIIVNACKKTSGGKKYGQGVRGGSKEI